MTDYIYDNPDLQEIMDQIHTQFETLKQEPRLITDTLNFVFINEAASHLESNYGYTKEQAYEEAMKMDVDLNSANLSHADVKTSARHLIDMTMGLLEMIEANFGESVALAMKKQIMSRISLSLE